MKAVVYKKNKSKEKLIFSEVEKPIPNDDEILVQIYNTSINAADYRLIQIGLPPKKKILGADIAGVVESVGKNIKNFKPGDEVIGDLSNFGFGGFAEYVAVPENSIILKPNTVSFEEASAIPLAGATALQAVREKGNIKKGDKVLIIGTSGGVGGFCVQLAKYFGAIVTGVCSTKNVEQTKLLGADFVIDYTKENFWDNKKEYDLIIGVNGDYLLTKYKDCLKKDGKFVFVGGSLSQIFKSLFFGKLVFLGSKKIINLFAKSNKTDLEFLIHLLKDKKIKPIIEKIYSLEEVPEVMHYVSEGHAKGKIVIKVNKAIK